MKKIFSITAATIFLFVFAVFIAMQIGVDSDALFPFSVAKDIVTGVSVKHWYFPGPLFFFPEILFSIPLVFILKTPSLWAVAIAFLQQLSLVLVICFFTEKQKSLSLATRFISAVFVVFITYLIGKVIFHWVWIQMADKAFIAVNHFSAQLISLILYFLTKPTSPQPISSKKVITVFLIAFATAFSDPLFILYFACLNLPYLFKYRLSLFKNLKWLGTTLGIACTALIGIFFNVHFNPGMAVELNPHAGSSTLNLLANLIHFFKNTHWLGVTLVFAVPAVLLFMSVKQRQTELTLVLSGLLLIGSVCVLLGLMNGDTSCLRYIGIYYLIMAYAFFELFSAAFLTFLSKPFIAIIALCFAISCGHHYLKNYSAGIFKVEFHPLLNCPELKQAMKNHYFVSKYWGAKLLFEYTDREASLFQVNGTFSSYHWIMNPAWQTLHGKKPTQVLICTYQMTPAKINAILQLPHANSLCNGQLIDVPFNQKIITLVPALASQK